MNQPPLFASGYLPNTERYLLLLIPCATANRSRAAGEDPGDSVGDIGDVECVVTVGIRLILTGSRRSTGENPRNTCCDISDIE